MLMIAGKLGTLSYPLIQIHECLTCVFIHKVCSVHFASSNSSLSRKRNSLKYSMFTYTLRSYGKIIHRFWRQHDWTELKLGRMSEARQSGVCKRNYFLNLVFVLKKVRGGKGNTFRTFWFWRCSLIQITACELRHWWWWCQFCCGDTGIFNNWCFMRSHGRHACYSLTLSVSQLKHYKPGEKQSHFEREINI